ncbi:MAG: methyltransferase domain-containing protein [Actinobacteria bacterium]|nr:methyltransferase domain-containing protein [Actinomycetota bacterium]
MTDTGRGDRPGAAVDDVAARGYEAGGDDYERSRPGYPDAAVDLVVQELALPRDSRVLELAAGTGKLTRMLVRRVAGVIAVEPVPAMRRRLAGAVPSVPAVGAVAEAIPLADDSVDGVVVATAFHWFRGQEAVEEIARVLRPRCGLGLLWNNPDRSTSWVADIWSVVDEHRGDTPGNLDQTWRTSFREDGPFQALQEQAFAHEVEMAPDDLVARVASVSFIAALPGTERADVLERVRTIIATHPELAGRPTFPLPYRTSVFWCRRR